MASRLLLVFSVLTLALIASWPAGWARDRAGDTGANAAATSVAAPDFAGIDHWFNSPPLTVKDLHGKVTLVEFWTHECINCVHVVPHTEALYQKYSADGLVVVGVHTPEFDEEHELPGIAAAIRQQGITYPVAVDNAYATWNAYGNQFWPAIYLIDQNGRIVYSHYGEGNYDETEARVRQLLGKA